MTGKFKKMFVEQSNQIMLNGAVEAYVKSQGKGLDGEELDIIARSLSGRRAAHEGVLKVALRALIARMSSADRANELLAQAEALDAQPIKVDPKEPPF